MMTRGLRYTPEEKENIRRVHASGKSYKSMAHLWPARNPADVARHASHMKLGARPLAIIRKGSSYMLPMLLSAVATHPGKAYDIAEHVGINKEYAGRLLREQCVAKPQTVHIKTWIRSRPGGIWVEFWESGPGPNAEKPKPVPKSVRNRAQRARARAEKNPFSLLDQTVAVLTGQPGRVFKQSMSIKDDELEAA